MGLPLTRVYLMIFPSRVSHCLYMDFKISFLRSRKSHTNSPLPTGFWFFFILFFSCASPMGLACTLIYENPVRLNPLEPCTTSFFFDLAPMTILLLDLFSKIVCVGFMGSPCAMYTCVSSKYMQTPPPLSRLYFNCKGKNLVSITLCLSL